MNIQIIYRKGYGSQQTLHPQWQHDRLPACRGYELGVIHWDRSNRVVRASDQDESARITRAPIPLSILGEVETRDINGKTWEIVREPNLWKPFEMAHENNGTFFSFCRDASLVYLNTNGPTSWRDNFDKILVNGQGKIEIATSVDPLAVKLFGTALASLLRRHFDLRVYFVEGNKEIGLGRPIIGTTETEEIFKPHRELVSKGCVMVSDCDYDPAGNYVGLGGGNVIALGVPPQEEKTANQPVSPATSASPELSRKRIDLVRNFLAAGQAPNIRAVIVFGSTARGQARTNSDLDLMLVCQTANRHEEEKFITTLCSLPDCPEILLPPTPIIPDEPDIFAREVSLKFIPFYLLERIGIKVSGAGLDPSKAFIEDYVVVARTSEEAEQIRAKIEAKKAEILNQLTQMGSSS